MSIASMRPDNRGEARIALRPKAKLGEVRAWLKAQMSYKGDDCLVFPFGRTAQGYGSISVAGRYMRAHQWMCRAAHGESPPGKPFALHSCGNGHLGCVNPGHLYWGSGSENYQDQVRHGVAARGAQNGRSHLCEAQVRQIRTLRQEGRVLAEIAIHVGAEPECVRSVLRGRTWKWLA